MEQDTTLSGTRTCAYCGTPLRPDARSDQQYCGRTHKRQARRVAKREAERHAERVDKYPPLADMRDDVEDDQDVEQAARPRAWDEADERFHALIGDNDEPDINSRRSRRMPLDAWRRWRAAGRQNPGVEPREQQQDRIARQKAARDAQAERIDAMWPGRVQDRHDPRTAGNPGSNGAASRRLNAGHVERPPSWVEQDFDFDLQPGESWTGGPFRSGRPSGQRSRHAAYAWRMDDGIYG